MESLRFLEPEEDASPGVDLSASSSSATKADVAATSAVERMLGAAAFDNAAGQGGAAEKKPPSNVQLVQPEPGFCVKTDVEHGGKAFINICHSPLIPSPPSISDEELALVIAHGDNSRFSVPMSVSDGHTEVDNAGVACTAYDVLVNSHVLSTLDEREGMREFLLELIIAHIEIKHSVALNRDYKILKRRKVMGALQPQLCRVKTRVKEISKKPLVMDTETAGDEDRGVPPAYKLMQEPPEGHPEFLVVEIELPKLKSTATSTLDVGEDRIVFHARPSLYHLELALPVPVKAEDTGAQFNRATRVLTVTLCAQEER